MTNKKADYLRFFKPCMIAVGIVLLISIILTAIFGFNKSVDFVGGTQLVVGFDYAKPDIDIEREEDFLTASRAVDKILLDNGARVQSFQVQGEYGTKSFVVTIYDTKVEKVNNIRVDINKRFNNSAEFHALVEAGKEEEIIGKSTDMTLKTSRIDGFISSHALLLTISSVIFALVLTMLYSFFRLRMAGGLTVVFGAIIDILLTLAFVSLARIQISSYIFAATASIAFISVFASSSLLFRIKELSRDIKYSSYTNYDLANLAVDKEWHKNLMLYIIGFIMIAVVGLVSMSLLHLSLVILAGLAVVMGTHVFLTPAFWALINKTREKVVTVQTEESRTDKSAEVIEIAE